MPELSRQLTPWINELISELLASDSAHAPLIEAVHPTHRTGARNLLHYALLRQRDVAKLQTGLSALGITRLSNVEPAVLARLHAARNVLDAFEGTALTYPLEPIASAFATADDILDAHSTELLGPTAEDTHSRIMVTLPAEAAQDPALVLGFAQAGMEIARINCAHDGPEVWAQMIENVHAAAAQVGREILVSMDLAGPKVRTGDFPPGPAVARARVTRQKWGEIITPAKLYLSPAGHPVAPPPLGPGRPGVSIEVDPHWHAQLRPGSAITLVDVRNSRRRFIVSEVVEDGLVIALGQRNAYIGERTLLNHEGFRTRVTGIAPIERSLLLHPGDELILSTTQEPAVLPSAGPAILGCTAPEAVAVLRVGHRVLFDDGSIAAVVRSLRAEGDDTQALLEVTRAGLEGTKLAAHKGINLPDTHIPLPSLSVEDLAAFDFVAHHADIAAISFIRTPADVDFALQALEDIARADPDNAERIRDLGIVLKIETEPAYEHLAAVLLAGMRHRHFGIMIARGDLAVELGFERMAEVPRLIMRMAEAAHIPVIMGTQILENLAKKGIPSRAEITDAGYALRSECVMLNKGPHIGEAIEILEHLSRKLGRSELKNRQSLRRIASWGDNIAAD